MVVAAGKPDLGPAEGSSGPADHADGRPATAYQLARARSHSRFHFRRGHHAVVAETLNAWLTIDDCLARGADRPGRIYLFRHLEAAGTRCRIEAGKGLYRGTSRPDRRVEGEG